MKERERWTGKEQDSDGAEWDSPFQWGKIKGR